MTVFIYGKGDNRTISWAVKFKTMRLLCPSTWHIKQIHGINLMNIYGVDKPVSAHLVGQKIKKTDANMSYNCSNVGIFLQLLKKW
jgi:hypothetical protein